MRQSVRTLLTRRDVLTAMPQSRLVWVADMYNSVVRRVELNVEAGAQVEGGGVGLTCVVSTLRLVDASVIYVCTPLFNRLAFSGSVHLFSAAS